MINTVSHISKEITEWECSLFIKAVSTKGNEAIGMLWMDWWMDYKNDKTNIISDSIRETITNAYINNSARLFLYMQKLKANK